MLNILLVFSLETLVKTLGSLLTVLSDYFITDIVWYFRIFCFIYIYIYIYFLNHSMLCFLLGVRETTATNQNFYSEQSISWKLITMYFHMQMTWHILHVINLNIIYFKWKKKLYDLTIKDTNQKSTDKWSLTSFKSILKISHSNYF